MDILSFSKRVTRVRVHRKIRKAKIMRGGELMNRRVENQFSVNQMLNIDQSNNRSSAK